jgi:hypothetical protein
MLNSWKAIFLLFVQVCSLQSVDSPCIAKRNPQVVGKALFSIFTEEVSRICLVRIKNKKEFECIYPFRIRTAFYYRQEIRYYTLKDGSRPVPTRFKSNTFIIHS